MSCFQMTTDEHMIEWHNYPKGRIGHLYIVAGFFSKRKKKKTRTAWGFTSILSNT